MMNLTIANISTRIPMSDFQATVAAIGRQVTEDFQPEWSLSARLRSVAVTVGPHSAPIQGNHDAILYVGDSSQDPTTGVTDALGYHSRNHAGIPYGFVYLDVCEAAGEAWSATLSHEVLELLADPTAVKTVSGPDPRRPASSVYYDLEVCDPTQGDYYIIDNVTVSNFVGQRYFGMSGGGGKTNFLDLDLAPFGVRPGGYFQYEDASGSQQVQGRRVAEGRLLARQLMGEGRRNTRRAERVQRDVSVSVSGTTGTSGSSVTVTGTVHLARAPLRQVLDANSDLRKRVRDAAVLAAYQVLRGAGVSLPAADAADIEATLARAATSAGPAPGASSTNGKHDDSLSAVVAAILA
jgi:hypothetical protein